MLEFSMFKRFMRTNSLSKIALFMCLFCRFLWHSSVYVCLDISSILGFFKINTLKANPTISDAANFVPVCLFSY